MLVARARKILRNLKCPDKDLSILLTDDSEIHELNKTYRGIDRPTDVLSFSQSVEDPSLPASSLLGDVVISCETAARQASQRHHSLEKEIVFLLVHGILHLLGYHHETSEKDREFMEKKTADLCDLVL